MMNAPSRTPARPSLPALLAVLIGTACALWGCASATPGAPASPPQPVSPISPPLLGGAAPAVPQAIVRPPEPKPAPVAAPSSSVPDTSAQPPTPADASAYPADAEAAKSVFADAMAARGLDPVTVRKLLAQARYSETVVQLVLPPASPSVRSWPRYRARFIDKQRIDGGLAFRRGHADTFARAETRFGVPASIIAAIIGVETFYGRITGDFRLIDALTTLAFSYPQQAPKAAERGAFFRDQLAEYLVWCKESGSDPLAVRGSYAGAVGLPQFMPGSIRSFAVDGDGDGRVDLQASADDAILSVANFLVAHGWQRDQPAFLPVRLPPDPAALVDGGLKPTLSWTQLKTAGAQAPHVPGMSDAWQGWQLAVIDLFDGATNTTEYRVAAPNFFAITAYNHSYFYATSVVDLAIELERRVRQGTAPQLKTPVDR